MKAMMTAPALPAWTSLARVLYQAAPLMMCGCRSALHSRPACSTWRTWPVHLGSFLRPAVRHPVSAALVRLPAGGGHRRTIGGIFPGLFKARPNVSEVGYIIMFNWIGMYLVSPRFGQLAQMLASGTEALPARTVPRRCLPPTPAPSCPDRSPGCSVIQLD